LNRNSPSKLAIAIEQLKISNLQLVASGLSSKVGHQEWQNAYSLLAEWDRL
jgi:hypothetical protein